MVGLDGRLEHAGRLLGDPLGLAVQPGVLGPGRGHRRGPLELVGGEGGLGGLLERGRGGGVAAAGLEQPQRHQRVRQPAAGMHPLGQRRPGVLLGPGPVPLVQPQAGAVPEQVLGEAGQLVGLDEGERPVEVLAGVAVVLHLDGLGGQVGHRPGGVVLQPGRDRHLEALLQLDPAARVAAEEPGRADVGQGVAEGLLVTQPPGQLDRPPGPVHRRVPRLASMSSWAWLL